MVISRAAICIGKTTVERTCNRRRDVEGDERRMWYINREGKGTDLGGDER